MVGYNKHTLLQIDQYINCKVRDSRYFIIIDIFDVMKFNVPDIHSATLC